MISKQKPTKRRLVEPVIRSLIMQTKKIIDLEEFLAQVKEWQNRLSKVRVTTAGKTWISHSITVSESILGIDGEDGFAERVDVNKAEVLERRDDALFAQFKNEITLELLLEV
jgi:hypothetical protein